MLNEKKLVIQTILFRNRKEDIKFSLENLANAIFHLKQIGFIAYVDVMFGDCSPVKIFQDDEIDLLNACYNKDNIIDKISYHFFNKNLGHGGGHNSLFNLSESDYLLILNPDVIVAPNTLVELYKGFSAETIGIVEARQIPLEHPKDYDDKTGDTSWASGACIMTKTNLMKQLNGFDHQSFFLYCDDVDFSWRMKLAGYRVIYQPSAVIFHDKRLTPDAKIDVSPAEQYYSAEAALMMAHKYSRFDLLEKMLVDFETKGNEHHKKALQIYYEKLEKKILPKSIDRDHIVSQFIEGNYAKHRF